MASSSNNTITTRPHTTTSFYNYPYPTEFNVLDFVPKDLSERSYDKWSKLMKDFIRSRDLIGFIDGTVKAPPNSVDSVASSWKRTDNLVRGWILATLTEDIRLITVDFETAEDVWTVLKKMFDRTEILNELDEENDERVARYLPLHIAVINGDWDTAIRIIEHDPDAVRIGITPELETPLILALYMPSRNNFVRKLLEKMSPEDVALVDFEGRTALHVAANVGNIEGAKMLVNRNKDLPNCLDNNLNTPLHYAAASGDIQLVLYLKEITSEDVIFREGVAALLLRHLTKSEFYDMALNLLQRKPELAFVEPNLFDIIVEKHSSFLSGTSLNFWQNVIYLGVPIKSESITNSHRGGGGGDIESPTDCCISVGQRLHFMIWEIAEKLVPQVKCIQEKKRVHHYALELLKFLCIQVAKSRNTSTVERILKPTLYKATYIGIPEIVEEIIVSYPFAMSFRSWNQQNILQYAIVCRRERVFNLVYQLGSASRYMGTLDSSGNNSLHLAGRLGQQQQVNLRASATGAVLQMQRELQWFKEVEKFSLSRNKEKRNSDGMTPVEDFSETHQELIKEGEQWMKDTATSCTIVAALIVTIVFAAAITVPGGNDNNNGYPLFSKRKAFVIFGVSDAVALFSSITSVLMFLLILTSRYSEIDFLYVLPKRLVTGLVTLFVSILSTMVAFGAILYLVFGENKAWILIPVIALASIPVTLFGTLQFPLLVEMIQSTYGRGIFGKQSDRMLE